MNIEQLITEYEQHKSLTKGFLLQQDKEDHKGIAQKIYEWAQEQGHTNTQQEIEEYLNTHSIGTKTTQW